MPGRGQQGQRWPGPGWAARRGRPGPCPRPTVTGLVRTSSTSEQLERGARPDDVDDGVERADLVEVDLVGAATPWSRPSPRPGGRRRRGRGRGPGRAGRRRPSERADRRRTVRWWSGSSGAWHDGAGGPQARPLDGLGSERPSRRHRQAGDSVPDLVDVGAGVEQGAERHVPGDAGEAVEPGERARRRSGPAGPLVAHAGDGAGRAEAVVDADHGHALRRTRPAWPAAR